MLDEMVVHRDNLHVVLERHRPILRFRAVGRSYNLLCYLVKVQGRHWEARVSDELARDEDDHDLLTFNESAIRLREEIAATEAALRSNPAAERRGALEARLAALAGALERNTRLAGKNPGETGFLNYVPRPAGEERDRPAADGAGQP
jgi:hypothetical protein